MQGQSSGVSVYNSISMLTCLWQELILGVVSPVE